MKATITSILSKFFGKKNHYGCMDCVKNLYSVLDGESSKDQEEYFRTHIDECSSCFNRYEIDKSVKEVIKFKVENKAVPSDLVAAIKERVRQNR